MAMFIVEAESGIRGNCLLGEGRTEAEAWEDAYGPKPWTPYQKKCAKRAWAREVSDSELEQIRADQF